MNGHLIGFHQLIQKLKWITPIISTPQVKKLERITDRMRRRNMFSLVGFGQLVRKMKPFCECLWLIPDFLDF